MNSKQIIVFEEFIKEAIRLIDAGDYQFAAQRLELALKHAKPAP